MCSHASITPSVIFPLTLGLRSTDRRGCSAVLPDCLLASDSHWMFWTLNAI